MSKRTTLFLSIILLSSAAVLPAQTGSSSSPSGSSSRPMNQAAPAQDKQSPTSDLQSGKNQTLVGCLMTAPAATSSKPSSSSMDRSQSGSTSSAAGNQSASNPSSSGTPQGTSSDMQGLKNPSSSGTVGSSASGTSWILKRQGTGEEISVQGSQLSEHSGHMVQLSGTLTEQNGRKTFNVASIKHMGNSCDATQGLRPAPAQKQENKSNQGNKSGTGSY